jgi:hypothetical protein
MIFLLVVMPNKPKGVIDDLFKTAGRKAVNEVRNLVRHSIAAERAVAKRSKVADNSSKSAQEWIDKQVKIGTNSVNRTYKGKTAPKPVVKKRLGAAEGRVKAAIVSSKNRTATADKLAKAEQRHTKLRSQARAHFPSEAAFARAVREEKHSMRTGIPVPVTPTKKIVKKTATAKAKPKPKPKGK